MPIVFTSRAFRSHQRRGKLHLRIASAERDRFAHPFITVDLHGKIRTRRISGRLQPIRVLTQPARLPIALHQISEIKRRQRILRILPSPPFQPKELLFRLEGRTRENPKDALAAFDFGYLVECYRQASWLRQHTDWLKASGDATGANLAMKIDGYEWVRKAIALRGSDPQMEFAAALMTTEGARGEHDRHLQNAMAGAKADAMLARNLESRFPKSAS